ncbi:UPF0149 family protein [Pseudothauera lacus]|nr:UPF0149 family protein [Pseudothauera lacus]
MTDDEIQAHILDDEAFDELEALLVSDAVPEDCMNLEMLDGYLAAVVACPQALVPAQWLPAVWSAHDEAVSFGSGRQMQQAITLVLRYYNELVATVGIDDGWEPFCYASTDGDGLALGEEWMAGFTQGLELWPADWESRVPAADADAARDEIARMATLWEAPDADQADGETRLQWLEDAAAVVADLRARWQAAGIEGPALAVIEAPQGSTAGPGRNEPCPCGSGKKFKKCCGAEDA